MNPRTRSRPAVGKISLFGKIVVSAFSFFLVNLASSSQAQTNLSFWNFLSGGDGVRMKQIIDDFNASQKEYKIVSTTLQWGTPFYTKLRTSIAVGQGPDIATLHLSRLGAFVNPGLLRAITPEEMASAGLKPDEFFDRPWQAAQANGKTYAIPLDTHPQVFYYNKDLLKQAGVIGADGVFHPPKDLAEFDSMLKAVKEKTGKFGVSFESGPPTPYTLWRLWCLFVYQQGAQVIDQNKLVYGEAGTRALQILVDWAKNGYTAKSIDYPTSVAQFVTGQSAFMMNGVWEVTTMVDGKKSGKVAFDYGVIPEPTFFSKKVTFGDSHGLVIPSNKGKPITPEKLKGVLQFMAYWENHENIWASGGHIPANKTYAMTDEFKKMEPNRDYSQESAEMVMFDPPGWYSGSGAPLQDLGVKYFMPAVEGQISVNDALKGFAADAQKLMNSKPR